MSEEERLASKFRRLVELREKRDEAKVLQEQTEKEYRTYESELYDELEESPLEGSVKLDLGPPHGTITFTPRTTIYGRIIDKDAALEYFDERGMLESISTPGIEKRRLNELVRETAEQGKPMPPGVDWYASRGVSISRKKS